VKATTLKIDGEGFIDFVCVCFRVDYFYVLSLTALLLLIPSAFEIR